MVEPLVALILVLATYRLTRIVVVDQIFAPVRNKVWNRFPPNTQIGYLLTCMWCVSLWAAIPLVLCYILIPGPTIILASILALSAAVGIIDTVVEK